MYRRVARWTPELVRGDGVFGAVCTHHQSPVTPAKAGVHRPTQQEAARERHRCVYILANTERRPEPMLEPPFRTSN